LTSPRSAAARTQESVKARKVSIVICRLILPALLVCSSCYGTPRYLSPGDAGYSDRGNDGAPPSDGVVPGDAPKDAGADDRLAPAMCVDGGACPPQTVCGPSNLCVDCSAITSVLPATPSLLRPMRGAYTGSLHAPAAMRTLRPTFTWAAVQPTCGPTTYELEADDSCLPGALDTCAFDSPELNVTGLSTTSYSPPNALKVSSAVPVGAMYSWRVRACDASLRCSAWSEVRYLYVGRVREDINGDGYGDLLAPVKAQDTMETSVEAYLGSSQFDVDGATTNITFGTYVFVGDVNGDGFGDICGVTAYTPSNGAVPTILFGGPDLANLSTLPLTKTAGGPSTQLDVKAAGDFNGDGFADLIIQWAYLDSTPQTQLRVFFGGTTIANTPDLTIPGPYVDFFTLQDSGRVGDVNGDGYEDIALVAATSTDAVVQIFAGGQTPSIVSSVDLTIPSVGGRISPAGDTDGDGFDEALLVQEGMGYSLYKGGNPLPTMMFKTWTDASANSGIGAFDIDNDGLSDFVIGRTGPTPTLYRGGLTPTLVPSGLSTLDASLLMTFSDHDGDGRPDFVGGNQMATVEWAGSDGTTNPRSVHLVVLDSNLVLLGYAVP
jgi:hypothetical protein